MEINGGLRPGHELALGGTGVVLRVKPAVGDENASRGESEKRVNRRENR